VSQIVEEFADERAEVKRIDTLSDSVKNLMDTMKWSADQSMKALKIPMNDRSVILDRSGEIAVNGL
jgi:hypothetical protein